MSSREKSCWNPKTSITHHGLINLLVKDVFLRTKYWSRATLIEEIFIGRPTKSTLKKKIKVKQIGSDIPKTFVIVRKSKLLHGLKALVLDVLAPEDKRIHLTCETTEK